MVRCWYIIKRTIIYLKSQNTIVLDHNDTENGLCYQSHWEMYIVLLLHCHHYCYCLCPVIYVIWLLDNLYRVEKLIEETISVFWVDLEYKLRSQNTVPLQGSGRWLTSHLLLLYYSTIPQWYCVYCLLLLTT